MEYIWAPLSIAREISRRIAWKLRFDLVPIFGFHFPTQCLAPNDPHFEDLSLLTSTRRANSRLAESSFARSTWVLHSGKVAIADNIIIFSSERHLQRDRLNTECQQTPLMVDQEMYLCKDLK